MYDHNKGKMINGRAFQKIGTPHFNFGKPDPVDNERTTLKQNRLYKMQRIGPRHYAAVCEVLTHSGVVQVRGCAKYCHDWWNDNARSNK